MVQPNAPWPSYPPQWMAVPPPPAPPRPETSAGAILAAIFVGMWMVGVTVAIQSLGWLVEQVLLVLGLPTPGWIWLIAVLLNAVLAGVPAFLLAVIPHSRPVRAAGRAWLLGTIALALLGAVRGIPAAHHELYLGLLTVAAGGLAFVLRRPQSGGDGVWFAIAAGTASLLPWLWIGALGGVLETVLAATAAVAIGWLASAILNADYWAAYQETRVRRIVLGGLAAVVPLVLIGAGAGASGEHLAELLVLPPLAFAVAALAPGAAIRWLVGLASVGPLAFVDNEEITLLLIGRDIPLWAVIAAASSLAVALVVGLVYAFALRRQISRLVAVATAGTMVLAGAAVYAGFGQPGLYGERLFVVMRDQADLSTVDIGGTGQAGRDARARATYELLARHAERTQESLREDLDRFRLSYTPYYLVNGVEVSGGPAVRAWLSRRDDVDRVLLSQRLRPLPAAPGTSHGSEPEPNNPVWNVTMLGADRAWSQLGVTGAGIVVGASDSGVDGAHPALAPGFRGGDDSWYDPWRETRAPSDRAGHGTHTLATAVGRTGTGVAPGAQWTGCVNLDRNLGNPARYLDCLQFMLAPFPRGGDPFADGRPERAPHVLTNSWGCPRLEGCDQGALRQATAALAAAGIFAVVAAGNTGPLCESVDDPPAPYTDVLTVGAVDRDREVTEFSSRGPTASGAVKPDLLAPGAAVFSAMPGGGYAEQDGTSMAAPHVAGVVALMWSANPALIGDLARTRDILRSTAQPVQTSDEEICDANTANVTGAGLVDAFAAVQAARG